MCDIFQSKFNMTESYYNKVAVNGLYNYFDRLNFVLLFKYICDWMESVSPECTIIEVGSGTAPILRKLKHTHQYTGIEISDKFISMCNKKWRGFLYNKHATFVKADLATYFDSSSLIQRDILYDGNVFWYFNRDKIADYLNNAMQAVQAKYFVTMECSIFFPFPECSFLKLIQAKDFVVDISSIPEFKRSRRIEIYERIQK